MSSKASESGVARLLKEQLRDPLRLRFLLCAVLLAAWYFGHHSPATGYILQTSGRTEKEKKRIATAKEVEKLRRSLAPYEERIPRKQGQNELIQYLMAHVRKTPLKIVDLSPDGVEDLGTLRAIQLKLKLEGAYSDLEAFLDWAQHETRLLRVDSLKIMRKATLKNALDVEVDLIGLVDVPKPPPGEKAASKEAPTKAKSKAE